MTSELIDWGEQQSQVAASIAIESGAIKCCRMHSGFFYGGVIEPVKAFKIAAARHKRGDFGDLFETQKELTDLIKDIVEGASYESCCLRCKEINDSDN